MKSLTENLVRSLGIHNMTDRRRITLIVQAYMLYSKLLKEDSFVNFPSSLSQLDQANDESKNHIVLLSKAMETLRVAIPKKLKQMVSESGDWDHFRAQLGQVMQQWEAVPETLFFTEEVSVLFVLCLNQVVLEIKLKLCFVFFVFASSVVTRLGQYLF